jgi:hypothetical protein
MCMHTLTASAVCLHGVDSASWECYIAHAMRNCSFNTHVCLMVTWPRLGVCTADAGLSSCMIPCCWYRIVGAEITLKGCITNMARYGSHYLGYRAAVLHRASLSRRQSRSAAGRLAARGRMCRAWPSQAAARRLHTCCLGYTSCR